MLWSLGQIHTYHNSAGTLSSWILSSDHLNKLADIWSDGLGKMALRCITRISVIISRNTRLLSMTHTCLCSSIISTASRANTLFSKLMKHPAHHIAGSNNLWNLFLHFFQYEIKSIYEKFSSISYEVPSNWSLSHSINHVLSSFTVIQHIFYLCPNYTN